MEIITCRPKTRQRWGSHNIATLYSPARDWPRRKLPWPLSRIHNWNGYLALSVACAHPLILLFATPKLGRFHVGDILLPISSSGQTFYNALGVLRLWLCRRNLLFPSPPPLPSLAETALQCLFRRRRHVYPRRLNRSEPEETSRPIRPTAKLETNEAPPPGWTDVLLVTSCSQTEEGA